MRFKKQFSIWISMVVIFSTIFTGCYDYKDINKITFVTSIIFDENDAGELEIYMDSVKPYRSANDSSDKGKRIVYKGTGKTITEAIRDVNSLASSKIDFTQCKAYVFTEKVAKSGIKQYMDVINKNQEFLIRPYMFVLFGNPGELLNEVEGDEEYLGMYINDLVHKLDENPRIIATDANEYLDRRTNYGSIMVLGALKIRSDEGRKRIELSGGALFKDEVMVRKINPSEGLSYNFLQGNVESGTLEAINPQDTNSFVTLEINKAKTKTSMEYDGERIKLFKNIKVRCYIAESQDRLIIDEDVLKIIEVQEEKAIEQYARIIFGYYKDDSLDILNVTRMFNQQYPDVVLKSSPLAITDIVVNVDVVIDGSSITGNTF